MPIFIPLMCLLGMGLARFFGHAEVVPADPAARADGPARLLRWAVGLLSAPREEWGRAMLGELGYIDGRGRRWRFAAGCAGAALLLPPWGRAAVPAWAMVAAVAGSVGGYAFVCARYGLGSSGWVSAVFVLVLLAGYALVAGLLLRQPGVALPGLLGGLLVAAMWLAPGFTRYSVVVSVTSPWALLAQVLVVPVLVGVAGTLWGGSAVAGRRIARLAAISAGLSVFLYANIAVAMLGAGDAQGDGNWTVGDIVSDRLGNNVIFYVWFLPLTTAAIAWAAAAATARISPRPGGRRFLQRGSAAANGRRPSGGGKPWPDAFAAGRATGPGPRPAPDRATRADLHRGGGRRDPDRRWPAHLREIGRPDPGA